MTEIRVTPKMVSAATDAWPHLDDSTDEALWGGVYRIMEEVRRADSVEQNPWRETVRDIYDALHVETSNFLALRLITLIEERHPDFFGGSDA